MKFEYRGIELEYVRTEYNKYPSFYFDHSGVHMVLYFTEKFGWKVALGNRVTSEIKNKNELYHFVMQEHETRVEIGKELIEFLLTKSPLRIEFLLHQDYAFLKKSMKTC
jgi:hypothetical protein